MASKRAPTTDSTIIHLREIFSRHGLPEYLVSDNASIFKSVPFTAFCERNGIQRSIAPGHPQTNGQAERYCQTLKNKLKCMATETETLHEKLHRLLFRYRATPLNNRKTPAELLLGYNLRTKLDLLRPHKNIKNSIVQPEVKQYKLGQRVQSRNYTSSSLWKYGTVVEKLGLVHYLIELDDGYVIKRHFDQLRGCEVENARYTCTHPAPGNHRVPFQHTPLVDTTYVDTPDPSPHKSNQCYTSMAMATTETQQERKSCLLLPVATSTPPRDGNQIQCSSLPSITQDAHSTPINLRRSARVRKPVDRLDL